MNCPACGQVNPAAARFCNECGRDLQNQDPTGTLAPQNLASNGFVGRHREMHELKGALEDAISGRGRLVMLAGEPGIGKTRTAQEAAAYAEQRGVMVLRGRCFETEGSPPYWPWVQVVRSYIEQRSSEQISSEMGSVAGAIAELVPEIRHHLPHLESLPTLDPQQARFRLFDAIGIFLKQASLVRPLMVSLDNLHWADPPSLLLLEFFSQTIPNSPMLVLGTYRDTDLTRRHPLTRSLGELTRESHFFRINLRGLGEEEVGSLIHASCDVIPSPALVEAVYTQTEGNPLFLTQVVQLLHEDGTLLGDQHDLRIQIPSGVHEAIGRRLDQLSQSCQDVLTIGAVIGREFDLALLESLYSDRESQAVLGLLEEATAIQVIEELPQVGRYQFTHALIQDTLSRELSATRRARLHQRIATSMEEAYASNLDAHALQLLHHFSEAAPVTGTDKLVQYALLAGEQALGTYAHEDAISFFQRGLDAREGQQMNDDAAALLFGLGRAQFAALERVDFAQIGANFRKSFDYYVQNEQVSRAVEVAEYPVSATVGIDMGRADLIAEALELVAPDSHQAGRLGSTYGLSLYYERGDYAEAIRAYNRSLAIARRLGDRDLEIRCLVGMGHAEAYEMHFEASMQLDLQAIELAGGTLQPYEEIHARLEVSSILHHTGQPEQARKHYEAMLALAERIGHRHRLGQAYASKAVISSLEGDWPSAIALSDQALRVTPRFVLALSRRTILEYTLGNYAEGRRYLDQMVHNLHYSAPSANADYLVLAVTIPLVNQITGGRELWDLADEVSGIVLSSSSLTPSYELSTRVALALMAVQSCDAIAAAEQFEVLEAHRGMMIGGGLESLISADRLLGLLAHTMGKLDLATVLFEDAISFCQQAGYRPELAWVCSDFANALLQRSGPGDVERAKSLLFASLALATELTMRPLMAVVQTKLSSLGLAANTLLEHRDGLTQREVEVLNLIAQGKSNREIGEALVIAEGTVRRHVNNIYDKTGVSNRAEATRYALEHNLTTQD